MDTPTTDHGTFLDPKQNLSRHAMNYASNGKVNAVVKKLVMNWRSLIGSESNVQLFAKLLKKGISTRDVHSFASKQANLRKVCKDLDKPLTRIAMRSKLNDACAFNARQKRVVNKLKRDLLIATEHRRFKQRRILKQIKTKMNGERAVLKKSVCQKVKRYEELQGLMQS